MSYNRPIVLSIAGFDATGGAGVLADIKTFEQHKCLGMAVNTSITNQVEDKFISVKWFTANDIIEHINPLITKYRIDFVKIGIIENLDTLKKIVSFLKTENKSIKIVWDTVLSSSTGFDLIKAIDKVKLTEILSDMYLITPNTLEVRRLSGIENEKNAAIYLSGFVNVLLKGGHSEENKGTDILFQEKRTFEIKQITSSHLLPKHGSGCILSSAITANLALGKSPDEACTRAKQYIETLLNSNTNLLAYHVA